MKRLVLQSAVVAELILLAVAFSPFVLSPNHPEPIVLDMPRTLFWGLSISVAMVFCTIIAALASDVIQEKK